MPVLVVSPDQVPVQPMPGRTLQWLIGQGPGSLQAEGLSLAVVRCQPGSVIRPLHAHRGIEEVVYILAGKGEAWVDGDTAFFRAGDVLLLPAGSKHMVRNTGEEVLVTLAIFTPPTTAEAYVLYEEEQPW